MINKLTFFLILPLMQFCCANEDSSNKYIYEKETEIFSKYLKSTHGQILQNDHVYLVVPFLRCEGCVQRTLKAVVTKLERINSKNNLTIIIPDLKLLPKRLRSYHSILIDPSGTIEWLDLKIHNSTLIETGNGKIVNIMGSNSKNLSNWISYFNKLYK